LVGERELKAIQLRSENSDLRRRLRDADARSETLSERATRLASVLHEGDESRQTLMSRVELLRAQLASKERPTASTASQYAKNDTTNSEVYDDARRTAAAIKVQTVWRGHVCRRHFRAHLHHRKRIQLRSNARFANHTHHADGT
jgi:hypothetical protein